MKKTSFRPSFLQALYFVTFLFLFGLIVFTPKLITGSLRISERLIIEEETIQGILLGVLFIVSILILNLYKLEVFRHKEQIKKINTDKQKVEERLHISDQYIGMINVQIQEIKSIFYSIDSYPQTKTDLKRTFGFFGEKILGIVNSNWALIRIINSATQRTISEHFELRENCAGKYPHVSNKMIIEHQPIAYHTSIISSPKNLNILVFCIMPVEKISHDEHVFIQAIIDEITKLFIIINSSFFKNDPKDFIEDKSKIIAHALGI